MLQGQEVDAMHRSQAMAEAGDVDGSMVCAQQAETYKKQHETLHTSLTAPERVMTVCEVCGVFINSTDNDQRRQVRKPMSEVSAEQRHLEPSFPYLLHVVTVGRSCDRYTFVLWMLFTLWGLPMGIFPIMGASMGVCLVFALLMCWQGSYLRRYQAYPVGSSLEC